MSTLRTRPRPPAAAPRPTAARRAHPVRSELLRGSAPWAGAAVLIAVALPMATKAHEWQGSWNDTQMLLRSASSLFAAPLAGAAGCWQGGRERRRQTGELRASAARGPLARTLTAALPTAVWAAVAYLLAACASLLACLPYASAGRPLVSLLIADAVFILAAALIGHVAGALVRWRLAAPLFAIALFLALGLPGYGTSAARHLTPSTAADGVMHASLPVWWQPPAAIAWAGGLAAGAVLAYAARRRYTALLPLALAASAAVALVETGDRAWRSDPLSERQVCDTSTTPAICVNAQYPGMLPEVRDALSGITGRLDGVGNLPDRFIDLHRDPRPGEARLPMLEPLGWYVVRGELTDREQYAWEAAQALTGKALGNQAEPCRARWDDQRVRAVDEAVSEWLAPHPAGASMDRDQLRWAEDDGTAKEQARASIKARKDAVARLDAMDPAERRPWLTRYFATAGDCATKGVPAL
ncbi:hypothetical protein ACWF94_21610 [Streptomyces sp. NPDC055078]